MGGFLETSHQKQLQEDYNIVKVYEDGTALLNSRKNKEEFLIRCIASNSREEIDGFA